MTRSNALRTSQITRSRVGARGVAVLAACALMLALPGCGKGKPAPKTANLPKPLQACELLTAAEIEAIAGGPVDEPVTMHREDDKSQRWASMCSYYAEEQRISAGIQIMTHGYAGTGAEAFAAYEAELLEDLEGEYVMTAVEGIGDKAGWEASTKQLTIFQGPLMIMITASSPVLEGADALEFNTRVAAVVMPKLPK